MKRITILFFVFFTNLSIWANEYETYIIIVGGGETPKDAESAKENYLKHTELTRQIKTTLQIVHSNNIKGLNPGFHIAIMGYCSDEYKASLLTNFANKYLKGVYYKKVVLKAEEDSPEFVPDHAPFTGKEFDIQTGAYNHYYNDVLYRTKLDVDKGKTVIVKTDKIIYREKEGLVDLKYYIAWIWETKQVVYLNQFQFTRLFIGSEEWIGESKVDEREVEYGPEFKAIERNEEVTYGNGVRSYHRQGYEWDDYSVTFPADKFTFEEIFNYYVGMGEFKFIFNDDIVLDENYEFDNDGECRKVFHFGKDIGIHCDHEENNLVKFGEEIVYSNGAGA